MQVSWMTHHSRTFYAWQFPCSFTSWHESSVDERYLHFQVVPSSSTCAQQLHKPAVSARRAQKLFDDPPQTEEEKRAERLGQWVNCDLRTFDYSVLGQ